MCTQNCTTTSAQRRTAAQTLRQANTDTAWPSVRERRCSVCLRLFSCQFTSLCQLCAAQTATLRLSPLQLYSSAPLVHPNKPFTHLFILLLLLVVTPRRKHFPALPTWQGQITRKKAQVKETRKICFHYPRSLGSGSHGPRFLLHTLLWSQYFTESFWTFHQWLTWLPTICKSNIICLRAHQNTSHWFLHIFKGPLTNERWH